jgi:hypothetical protein
MDLKTYQRDNVIPLPRSVQKTSAGRGAYLGPEEMETIWVEENDLTRRASFCVPVTGDSMEPTYHDGDILLVEGREDIEPGQIGVFTVDGKMIDIAFIPGAERTLKLARACGLWEGDLV